MQAVRPPVIHPMRGQKTTVDEYASAGMSIHFHNGSRVKSVRAAARLFIRNIL